MRPRFFEAMKDFGYLCSVTLEYTLYASIHKT